MYRKGKPHSLLVAVQTGAVILEIDKVNPYKAKDNSTVWPRYNFPLSMHKGLNILLTDTCSVTLFDDLFTIAKKWNN